MLGSWPAHVAYNITLFLFLLFLQTSPSNLAKRRGNETPRVMHARPRAVPSRARLTPVKEKEVTVSFAKVPVTNESLSGDALNWLYSSPRGNCCPEGGGDTVITDTRVGKAPCSTRFINPTILFPNASRVSRVREIRSRGFVTESVGSTGSLAGCFAARRAKRAGR